MQQLLTLLYERNYVTIFDVITILSQNLSTAVTRAEAKKYMMDFCNGSSNPLPTS